MIDKREITPRLLAEITVVLFRNLSIQAVLEERCPYNNLSADDVVRIIRRDAQYARNRTDAECKAIANSVIGYVNQKTAWQGNRQVSAGGKLDVFELLRLTVQDLLVMNQNRMEIRYQEIDAWRLLVRYLGEELPLAVAYARWDFEHQRPPRDRYDAFDWAYVSPHNNKHLNAMVSRGVSEHHSHLWGSTPYFHVSWVNLMNTLTDSQYRVNLHKINPEPWSTELERLFRRSRKISAENLAVNQNYWELAQTRAAWIRLYLCRRLCRIDPAMEKEMQHVRQYDNWRLLLMSRARLQSELNSCVHLMGGCCDYALYYAKLKKPGFALDYHILIGERWLYYRIFTDYCRPRENRQLNVDDYNLFFVYFLIRLRIRSHMVQNNDYMGFDNFQKIERRKAYFLKERESERQLTRLTINDTLRKPYVDELEVRISPSAEQVRRVEAAVLSKSGQDSVERFLDRRAKERKPEEDLRERYYYVFHFLKKQDSSLEEDEAYNRARKTGRICRHDRERQAYLKQARQIMQFRENVPELACRVLGIDAASRELGCRPEVFGRVYRMLGEHQCCYGGYTEELQRLPALGKTYHVGEDFPDVVNGLRAIDEAIKFLDLDCGDRLGHALALGVNVEEWYAGKKNTIMVSAQERIDDLAWLYHALVRFSIPNVESLKARLERDFNYWFNRVYLSCIDPDQVWQLMCRAKSSGYAVTKEDQGWYSAHTCHFTIMDYYRAWTLRGDDPSCYIDGYFKKPRGSNAMSPEEKAKVCENYPPSYTDRYISEYSLLNYIYQFNDSVRRLGMQDAPVEITQEYIQAVKAVQIQMRYYVADKGISIETNPTSNVLIGSFREYGKHPILAFNNRGLPVTDREEDACAQLQISVNTDDSGVFYTDLETEYALLAHSVEQLQDENGQPRFKKNDIYAWLDHIRVMGNDQTFRQWGDPDR